MRISRSGPVLWSVVVAAKPPGIYTFVTMIQIDGYMRLVWNGRNARITTPVMTTALAETGISSVLIDN
jgi:hypothetical protein